MKNPIQLLQTTCDNKLDTLSFFNELEKQNKLKEWSINPIKISFTNGVAKHNAEEISNAVEKVVEYINDEIEESESVSNIEDMKKQTSTLYAWLNGVRVQTTKPFDDIKSSFTKSEKLLKSIDFSTKINKLNEKVYAKRATVITDELIACIADTNLNIDIDSFKSFIDNSKKLKKFDLSKTEALSKSAKDTIFNEVQLIAKPLIEAKAKAEQEKQEHQQLLSQIATIKKLPSRDGVLKQLEDLLITQAEQFPNITHISTPQINAEIGVIKREIEADVRAKVIAENENLDEAILVELRKIATFPDDITFLEQTLQLATADKARIVSDTLMVEANYILKDLVCRIDNLKSKAIVQEYDEDMQNRADELQGATIEENECNESSNGKYRLSDGDIEFIKLFSVEADNEEEAKKMMVEQFRVHLDFVELVGGCR